MHLPITFGGGHVLARVPKRKDNAGDEGQSRCFRSREEQSINTLLLYFYRYLYCSVSFFGQLLLSLLMFVHNCLCLLLLAFEKTCLFESV